MNIPSGGGDSTHIMSAIFTSFNSSISGENRFVQYWNPTAASPVFTVEPSGIASRLFWLGETSGHRRRTSVHGYLLTGHPKKLKNDLRKLTASIGGVFKGQNRHLMPFFAGIYSEPELRGGSHFIILQYHYNTFVSKDHVLFLRSLLYVLIQCLHMRLNALEYLWT